MRLMLRACLMLGMLAFVTQAVATPLFSPFLSVDINGANTAGGQTIGPTEASFLPWDVLSITDEFDANYGAANNWTSQAVSGMSQVFASSEGNITATLYGVGTSYSARNRGDIGGGYPAMYRDFPFAQRDNALGFGRNYLKLTLSGLSPSTQYEFTGFNREPAFTVAELASPLDPGQSFQAWTDLATLGGADGPAAWLDANVGAGESYQPAVGGVNNPIPNHGRSQVAGPDSLSLAHAFFHSTSFVTTSDAGGVVTVYTWADPNGFGSTVQGASLLNGFSLASVPEPASLALVFVALAGLAGLRRR